MLVLSCVVGLTECLCNTGWFGYKCLVKVTDSDFSVKCSVEPWLSGVATLFPAVAWWFSAWKELTRIKLPLQEDCKSLCFECDSPGN